MGMFIDLIVLMYIPNFYLHAYTARVIVALNPIERAQQQSNA